VDVSAFPVSWETYAMKSLLLVRCCACCSLILFCSAASLYAGTMLSPVAVTETDLGTNDPTTPLMSMINQAGLDKPFTSGATDFDAYLTTGAQPFAQAGPGEWWSSVDFSLPVEGQLDFDLGAVYTIDRMAIWNRTLEDIQIHVSETLGGPMQLAGSFTLSNQTSFFFSYLPETVNFNAAFQARYLRIEIDSAYKFDITDTFAYAIVGEVVVESVPPALGPPGDFDLDHDVDGDDLVEWRSAFSATDVGDADDDGDSDGDDFLIWQRQLGMSNSAPAVTAVPEPGTLWGLMTGMLGVFLRRSTVVRGSRG
jgi:hypothetical protein